MTSPRVLLVCDTNDGMLVRRTILEEAGYVVCTLPLVQAVRGQYGQSTFEIAVLAVNNVERVSLLVAGLGKLFPLVSIVLVSGFVEHLGLTAESTGVDAVVEKTASEAANLLRAVKKLLRKPKRQPQPRQLRVA